MYCFHCGSKIIYSHDEMDDVVGVTACRQIFSCPNLDCRSSTEITEWEDFAEFVYCDADGEVVCEEIR